MNGQLNCPLDQMAYGIYIIIHIYIYIYYVVYSSTIYTPPTQTGDASENLKKQTSKGRAWGVQGGPRFQICMTLHVDPLVADAQPEPKSITMQGSSWLKRVCTL